MDVQTIKLDHLSGRSFDELIENNIDGFFELFGNIMSPQFTISDAQVEHRTILHWEKEGLIESDKSENGGWRRYSFSAYVWLRLIKEMRGFGVPIAVLKKVKAELFIYGGEQMMADFTDEDYKKVKEKLGETRDEIKSEFEHYTREDFINNAPQQFMLSRFNMLLLEIIYKRSPAYLLLFGDGIIDTIVIREESMGKNIQQLLSTFEQQSTLIINISNIIEEFFSSEKFGGNTHYKLAPINRQEKEIVDIIRAGGVNKIEITLKNGKEFFVEIYRKKPARKIMDQIEDIIAKKNYSRIAFDTEKGRVAYITEIEKRIVK